MASKLTNFRGRNVEVKGMREVGEALRALPDVIKEKVVRGAAARAAGVLRSTVIANAPIGKTTDKRPGHPGLLRRAIRRARRTRGVRQMMVEYVVYVKSGGKKIKRGGTLSRTKVQDLTGSPYYWYFLEFGTSKMSARPFLLHSLESNAGELLELQRDLIRRGVLREARKLYKKPT